MKVEKGEGLVNKPTKYSLFHFRLAVIPLVLPVIYCLHLLALIHAAFT